MNIGITQINNQANYKNNMTFGSVEYNGKKAVKLAKRISLSHEKSLEYITKFENGIFKGEDAPRAIIGVATGLLSSILGFFGKEQKLSVTVVDNSDAAQDNCYFNNLDAIFLYPFDKVEEYGKKLMEVNKHFANVQLATKEDFIPGPSKSDSADKSGVKVQVKHTVVDREIYDKG